MHKKSEFEMFFDAQYAVNNMVNSRPETPLIIRKVENLLNEFTNKHFKEPSFLLISHKDYHLLRLAIHQSNPANPFADELLFYGIPIAVTSAVNEGEYCFVTK